MFKKCIHCSTELKEHRLEVFSQYISTTKPIVGYVKKYSCDYSSCPNYMLYQVGVDHE